MNRAQRRAANSRREDSWAKRIRELQHRVQATGLPDVIDGLTDACIDCHADGAIVLLPGRRIVGQVFHDDHCPAAAGIVNWEPVP